MEQSHPLSVSPRRLCVWTLVVPEGMHLLLTFADFDAESCPHSYLSVYSLEDVLVGEWLFMLSSGH